MIQLIDPESKKHLFLDDNVKKWVTNDKTIFYDIENNVVKFLKNEDCFYEGAYLNRIKFLPKSEFIWHSWPLWLISNGYLWEVRKQFKPGDAIVELGCASGVDYFGERFKMIGLDLSFESLKCLNNYQIGLQADATKIPLTDHSVDGVISSYFWEHIPPSIKDKMLKEFERVLKPGGKIVFLYDVETQNKLVGLLKKNNPKRYQELFLDGDGHFGYETPEENRIRFLSHGYSIIKHFGMERTCFQSNSVFEKLRRLSGFPGLIGKLGYFLTTGSFFGYISIIFIRVIDSTFGRMFRINKSRIILTVLNIK